MEIKEIKKFDELLEAFESQKAGQNFVYRGVSNSKYQLITSLGRCESAMGKPIERLEIRLTKLFKESSIPYLEHKPDNELEWLAVAQHYGLPTRLLDWSYNPLVSTYFAVESNPDNDSAVYILSGCSTIQDPYKTNPYKLDRVYKYRPPYISARIQNQSGVFTVHNAPDIPWEHDKLKKVVIPKELKPVIKKTLFKYGVNQRLIYPGLEGVARDLKWLETKMF
ncbi:FRG domain-containing protein [Aquimarina gracilis]|uniref:FRG domain-containing protein n=1 Tax=Aquimarina gracilis TaxID=874422 RepID=A0ABU6A1U9_9FLAO|nr:FRG domain-containing protein [Aquimarina gracilis]MEB3348128.1 FRG domain-containing protein [Aquimarina gracilis]